MYALFVSSLLQTLAYLCVRSSVIRSLIPSTPSERPSQPSTLSMPSSGRDVLSTVSVLRFLSPLVLPFVYVLSMYSYSTLVNVIPTFRRISLGSQNVKIQSVFFRINLSGIQYPNAKSPSVPPVCIRKCRCTERGLHKGQALANRSAGLRCPTPPGG